MLELERMLELKKGVVRTAHARFLGL